MPRTTPHRTLAIDRRHERRVKQLDVVKSRLAPWLNAPYFSIVTHWHAMAAKRCTHENHGVDLDLTDRRVICKGCRTPIDAFDALIHFAKSEERLVSTWKSIQDAHKNTEDRLQREKERRPFKRAVVKRVAIIDMDLKSEPIVGYTNILECGHEKKSGPDRKLNQATCYTCQLQAKGARKPRATP